MNDLLTPLVITGQVLAMILAADLLIALAHRLMDKFGDPSWRPKLLGQKSPWSTSPAPSGRPGSR
jgi:hypothetical protein